MIKKTTVSFVAMLIMFLLTNNLHAQNNNFSYDTFFDSYNFGFPYKINFTSQEQYFLKKLDTVTLEKLKDYAKNLYNRNINGQQKYGTSTNSITKSFVSTSTASTTINKNLVPKPNNGFLYNLLSSLKPQPNTNKASSDMPSNFSGDSGLNDGDPNSNPNFNPDNAPKDIQPTRAPLNTSAFVDFSKLPPGLPGGCPNNGVNGNINGINPIIKIDTDCLCIALSGQLRVVSAYRPGDPRNHGKGLAIDIVENNYRNAQKDAILVLALIGLKYNIGSYHPGFGSFHADIENSGRWKTWSGVAHTNYQGAYTRNYYMMIQDALNLIGMPAQNAIQFRTKYGNQSKELMSRKAIDFIEKNGNDALKKCMASANAKR